MPDSKYLQRTEEIYQVISRLFFAKGYHATSMREIARELDMNQSSLYYYFQSKEEILFKLIENALDAALAILQDICERDIPPEEKLNKVLRFYIRHYGKRQEALSLLLLEVNSLSKNYRGVLIEKQRRFVKMLESIFQDLANKKKMKPIPAAIATFAFFGMVHYIIRWYRKDGSIGEDELAELFLEIFTRGILLPPLPPAEETPGVSG